MSCCARGRRGTTQLRGSSCCPRECRRHRAELRMRSCLLATRPGLPKHGPCDDEAGEDTHHTRSRQGRAAPPTVPCPTDGEFDTVFPERALHQRLDPRAVTSDQKPKPSSGCFAVRPLLAQPVALGAPRVMVHPHLWPVLTEMTDSDEPVEDVGFFRCPEERPGAQSLVESADCREQAPAYTHVRAGGEVPRRIAIEADTVRQHDVRLRIDGARLLRRYADPPGNERVARFGQRRCHGIRPAGVHPYVVVDEAHELVARRAPAGVARAADTGGLEPYEAHVVFRGDPSRLI